MRNRRSIKLIHKLKKTGPVTKALLFALSATIVFASLAFGPFNTASAQRNTRTMISDNVPQAPPASTTQGGKTVLPRTQRIMVLPPVNVREAARQEALAPKELGATELRVIDAPRGDRPPHPGAPILLPSEEPTLTVGEPNAPPPSPTGISPVLSPGPSKTFKGQESLVAVIPPDTDGAVGTTHVVTATNDRLRIHNRNGVIVSTVTTFSFWSGVLLEGGAAVTSITDPRIVFDRFNNRFIFSIVVNPQTLTSSTLFAVTQTADPTGTWNRFAVEADTAATVTGGKWADFPSIGFNKDWIVIQLNLFGFGSFGTGYQAPQILVIDKVAAYANTLSVVSIFEESFATGCVGPIFETQLGCGFTMAPARTEDNTTATVYLIEDWDSQAAQLRLSKITGPLAAPVLTVGTQIPQSVNSWRFNATRIQTSGGYLPQRQQSANAVSGSRMMANDSRLGSAPVFRNGSLWVAHHVMIATTPTPAGTQVGGGGLNPADNHTAIQWWEIDPTIETGLSTVPIQRARIEDSTADNCHDGANALVLTPPCNNSALNQHGTFFTFPSISVNQNDDVLIGYSQFSALTYASGAYSFRANTDPINTTRNPVVFHPGQSNDNLGAGSGVTRQNRWGDYSATMTDPLNDTDFWTTQMYPGVYRDFGIGVACPWETWWALVKPSTPAASTSGSLIISEFRLRGPQGVRDEFVELYNPGPSPVIVNTTDNSDGWALAFSPNGTTITGVAVIPNGTVIPATGHFLFANNPDSTGALGLPTVVYSLTGYANTNPPGATQLRTSESDTGWAFDLADNGGFAIFKTANTANMNAATRMDSAGFAGIAAGLFKEGAGIASITGAPTGQISFNRSLFGFTPQDTGDNAADFIFTDTVNETLGVQPRLGAPGPENLDGPIRNINIFVDRFNPTVASNVPNNVFRKVCGVAEECLPLRSQLGTLSIRRKVTNFTAAPVTRIRFRIRDITTLPSPVGTADLRPITSLDATDIASGLLLRGTTLEEPPTQALGGGWNSSWALGIVTLAAPLAPGASVNVQFLVGVQQSGSYRIFVITEALP